MPIQQTHTDLHSAPQKLSKIETLRLARNYIFALSQTLKEGKAMDITRYIKILSGELSQTTSNLLMGTILGNYNPYNRYNCAVEPYRSCEYQTNHGYHQIDYNFDPSPNLWFYGKDCQNYLGYNQYRNDLKYWESRYTANEYMYYKTWNNGE